MSEEVMDWISGLPELEGLFADHGKSIWADAIRIWLTISDGSSSDQTILSLIPSILSQKTISAIRRHPDKSSIREHIPRVWRSCRFRYGCQSISGIARLCSPLQDQYRGSHETSVSGGTTTRSVFEGFLHCCQSSEQRSMERGNGRGVQGLHDGLSGGESQIT